LITRPFQTIPAQAERSHDALILELQARLELESQNQKLKELLVYSATNASRHRRSVVGRSADHWWQQVTLGRGTQAGIQVGLIVTAPGGLVGRVISHSNTSRVLLISDQQASGVTISRSRYMGFLRGTVC